MPTQGTTRAPEEQRIQPGDAEHHGEVSGETKYQGTRTSGEAEYQGRINPADIKGEPGGHQGKARSRGTETDSWSIEPDRSPPPRGGDGWERATPGMPLPPEGRG